MKRTPKEMDSYWFSKISAFRDCPRRYLMEYGQNGKQGGGATDATHYGSAVHEGIEEELRGGHGVKAFLAYWEALDQESIKWMRWNWEYLRDCGITHLEKFRKYHAKHIEPILIEERLYGEAGYNKYEGTPDVYGDYKGKRTIIDFKTSGYAYPKDKVDSAIQLYSYSSLLEQNDYPLPEQLVYMVFVKGTRSVQVLKKDLTHLRVKSIMGNEADWIEQIQEAEAKDRYPKNPQACYKGQYRCWLYEHCWGKKGKSNGK